MGKSFVLRDDAGTAVGCLMQGMDGLHLSLRNAKETDEIALLTKDGTWKKRRIGRQADGGSWLLELCDAESVLMLRDGKIMADSGAETRRRFEAAQRNAFVAERAARQTEPEPTDKRTKQEAQRRNDERFILPERRWPPPPCLGGAVYHRGKWMLKSE